MADGDSNYWSRHYIAGSCVIGIGFGIILSMLLWFIHELYFLYRLYKHGIITDAKITRKHDTKLATKTRGKHGNKTRDVHKYEISYQFYDDHSDEIMNNLLDIYCPNDIPNDLKNLFIEYIGDEPYQYCYGPYKTNKMEVNHSMYYQLPECDELIKIRYDPKHPNNRMILDIGWKGFISNISLFVISLLVLSISFWCIIQFAFIDNNINHNQHLFIYDDGDDDNKILLAILLIIIFVVSISMIVMIAISYYHKSLCFIKYNQTELQCNVVLQKENNGKNEENQIIKKLQYIELETNN